MSLLCIWPNDAVMLWTVIVAFLKSRSLIIQGEQDFSLWPTLVRFSQVSEICAYWTTKGLGPSTAWNLGISRWISYSSYTVFFIQQGFFYVLGCLLLFCSQTVSGEASKQLSLYLPACSRCPQCNMQSVPQRADSWDAQGTTGWEKRRYWSKTRCRSPEPGRALSPAPWRPDHTTSPRCVVRHHEGSCCTCFIYCRSCLIAPNNHTSMLRDEIACLGIF